ncbi:hypothetical protein ACFL1D_05745 [Candidatus Omnitrophota bacterium]
MVSYFCLNALGCASVSQKAETLRMLRSLGANDKLKQQQLSQETKNFQKIKKYIEERRIKEGVSRNYAIRAFGEPVVILPLSQGEKWAYKPRGADWFAGEKAYLFFDANHRLVSWECADCQE